MKRNILHTFWAAAMLLTACTQEELPLPGTSDATPFSITVTDGGYASSATRAAENGYSTEFTAGDECGLYVVRGGVVIHDNVKITATAGADGSLSWQPEPGVTLTGGMNGENYFLYYPYQESMTGKTNATTTTDDADFFANLISSWQPQADQSTYAAYTASDLMTAKGTARKAGNKQQLSFSMTHRMAMAVIEIPKTVYKFTNTDGAIPDYTVTTAADFTGSGVQPYAVSPGTYRYIVNPASGTTPSITGSYADGKKEFTVTPSGIAASNYKTYKVGGTSTVEKEYELQAGDFYCSKETDGVNTGYVVPQEAAADLSRHRCIGIVFYAGQHETDKSDYTNTGIGLQQCHGYVVALTDVHNGRADRLRWEYGTNNVYNEVVGTSTSTDDWQGYFNHQKFHEFVNNNTDWEMKHFPAALACETYGNRTTDQDGNSTTTAYNWQKPLAAPINSSGWFLPSYDQLSHLYANRSLLSSRMTDVKNSVPADCKYKDYTRWLN